MSCTVNKNALPNSQQTHKHAGVAKAIDFYPDAKSSILFLQLHLRESEIEPQ